ncbi:MAG: Clp protease ClpP [Firmicutes bacterium]|nr:Clp protease ClpP [Bacillota bacterium]
MNKFWNWVTNEGERTLYLDGYIASDSWFDDDVTPKEFKAELQAETGDITVWINSPGGDCFAASQIFTMLMEYRHDNKVTVKIDGIAASAASVIAMAGNRVLVSPTAVLMIHNPATIVWGEETDMVKAKEMLSEVKESIINAYELKTGLSRDKISKMMDSETWMSAAKAVELGFADDVLYKDQTESMYIPEGFMFNKAAVVNTLLSKLPRKEKQTDAGEPGPVGTDYNQLVKRLELIK